MVPFAKGTETQYQPQRLLILRGVQHWCPSRRGLKHFEERSWEPRSISDALTFDLLALRFRFAARQPVHFPPGKSGNVVRGAFGTIFRRIASPDVFARIFAPVALARGPSGLRQQPRPFVFRATHLDGRTLQPGEPFHFDVHLFDTKDPPVDHFVQAFAELARAELVGVDQTPVSLRLDPGPEPVSRVAVRFLTPTELKRGDELAERPEFPILVARIRDRLSTLRALYGPGPLEIDFKAFGERAAAVRVTRCELRWIEAQRVSTRTGQRHPLGGFTGEAEYEGDLREFLPYLRAARWTGVGRQTVWGKGVVEVLGAGATRSA